VRPYPPVAGLAALTGDSAIVEYIQGKKVIHHDHKNQVMTNSPTFDEQLALNELSAFLELETADITASDHTFIMNYIGADDFGHHG
jgi:penicillin V acylase-like amidase (Ntn superfamily)